MKIFLIGGETDEPGYTSNGSISETCRRVGCALSQRRHTIVVCSPFKGSADIEAIQGASEGTPEGASAEVRIHFPETTAIREQVAALPSRIKNLGLLAFPHEPPLTSESEALSDAWLISQVAALEDSHAVVAIGGKPFGTAKTLLLIAEARAKDVVPVPYSGGAAARHFARRELQLRSQMGPYLDILTTPDRIDEIAVLTEHLAEKRRRPESESPNPSELVCFISYPRARPSEADFIETVLRRVGVEVLRDEAAFGAGHNLPETIRRHIHESNVFLVVWCTEYACSPHCFDEISLAFELMRERPLQLWILCIDGTRMVPPFARDAISYRVESREEIEGRLMRLIKAWKL